MKRNAWLAILLSLVMLVSMLSLTACSKKEEKKETEKKEEVVEQHNAPALPFDLKFGMSYDDFCDTLEAHALTAPALDVEEDEEGYFTDGVSLPLDDPSVWDFIGSDFLKRHASGEEFDPIDDMDFYITRSSYSYCRPALYASFNRDKEMYEFYLAWNTVRDDFSAAIIDDVAETYNAFFDADGMVDDYTYKWEDDKYEVLFGQEETLLYLIICDKAHDLDG
ncbi:MAG: hypothetical protein IKA50_03545 [Clostridia bacterium]|nr:hypothetical protein [Clostridia bacterium]